MTIAPNVLTKLRQFDTPTICNVIELFEVRSQTMGYMDARIKANFPELPPMVGFAATASFRCAAPPRGGSGYGGLQDQLEQFAALPGPAVVVFQDLDSPAVGATFGEVMCSTYQAFGSAGLITSGAGRDLEQVRALRYPVFTETTICSHGYNQILHIGLPVHVGGLMVSTGDLLHGDANGVTNIPSELAAETADVASEFMALETILMNYVKGDGEKTLSRFNEARQHFQNGVAKLKQRVSRKR